MAKKLKIVPLEERIVFDAAAGVVIFVDVNATGANDGSSWSDAFTDLQSALTQAGSTVAVPEQIWVADGVYKPGSLTTATFNVPDLTTIRGGFGGTTILSGDIGVIGDNTDNINTIVKMSAATVTLKNMTVEKGFNPISSGAGIFAQNTSHLTLNNMIINDNFANDSGGGVFVRGAGSTLEINRSAFINNRASLSGGAILMFLGATDLTISHSLFDNNTSRDGAAIQTTDVVRINVDHTSFTNNSANGSVGRGAFAVDVNGVLILDMNVDHSLFENNSSTGSSGTGGALFVQQIGVSAGNLSIDHTVFRNNSATLLGGGLVVRNGFATNGNLSIEHSSFEGNSAGSFGGAMATIRTTTLDSPITNVTIDNTKFLGNTASSGGAIYDNSALSMSVSDSEFRNNSATGSLGGAVYVSDLLPSPFVPIPIPFNTVRTVTISDSRFKENKAVNGGAIGFEDPATQNITLNVTKNQFNKNSASSLGGAYYQTGGISNIFDNHFNKNYDPNRDQVAIDLPATVNGQTTAAAIIDSLVSENKKLDDSEISII